MNKLASRSLLKVSLSTLALAIMLVMDAALIQSTAFADSCTPAPGACKGATGALAAGNESCIGTGACKGAEIGSIGLSSCLGSGACKGNTATIGDGSCVGTGACQDNTGNVGLGSCIGPGACKDNTAAIGAGSCNAAGACRDNTATIPAGQCNLAGELQGIQYGQGCRDAPAG